MRDDEFLTEAYLALLNRPPKPEELDLWNDAAPSAVIAALRNSHEFKKKSGPKTFVPPGHYYSPVVDPSTVRVYHRRERASRPQDIAAINIDAAAMAELWASWRSTMATIEFAQEKTEGRRFFLKNANCPYGDAAVLRATIAELRPARIIEIGSGNSTACMLDTVEEFRLDTKITCIEPNPERLKSILRTSDELELIATPVQNVPVPSFDLDAGDMLFIDSTHVLKTGSDVHYELFHVLPSLRAGVVIHFHDCPYPFEYHDKQVFQKNMSWNELYALRAFLMYNNAFRIRFWASFFLRFFRDSVAEVSPEMLEAVGSGVWLEKTT